MFIQKHFLPIVEENRKAGEWFTMISPLCSRMIFRVGALNTGWLITENYLSFLNVHSKKRIHTGKSLSESFIFASTNPQYDDRLFIELQVQYMKIPSSNLGRTCCVQKLFLTFRTIFVHNMFSPCSAKRRASDKDLPVIQTVSKMGGDKWNQDLPRS